MVNLLRPVYSKHFPVKSYNFTLSKLSPGVVQYTRMIRIPSHVTQCGCPDCASPTDRHPACRVSADSISTNGSFFIRVCDNLIWPAPDFQIRSFRGNNHARIHSWKFMLTINILKSVSYVLDCVTLFTVRYPLGTIHPIYRTDVPLLPRVCFLYI